MIINPVVNNIATVSCIQNEIDVLKEGVLKNLSYKMFLNHFSHSELLNNIVDNIIALTGKDNLSIAVKVKKHNINDQVCIGGWHIDTVRNLLHQNKVEEHFLWMNHTGTEFLLNPYEIDETRGIIDFTEIVPDKSDEIIFKTNPFDIIHYNRYNLHRGCQSESTNTRLLVRVSKL